MSIEILREITQRTMQQESEELEYYEGYYEDNFSEWYEVEEGQKCQSCYGTGIDKYEDADCLVCYGEGFI